MKKIADMNTVVAEAMEEIAGMNGAWEAEEAEYAAKEKAYDYECGLGYIYEAVDVLPYTYEEIKAMTKDERREVRKACEKHLDYVGDDWDYYYPIYETVNAVEDDEYREENEDKVRAFFKEHFEGKTWEEIRNNPELYDAWGYYSDWHKDCFGYRPHDIVCGVYVRPW